MNEKTQGFVRLIDRASHVAKERLIRRESGYPDPAPAGALENISAALNHFRKTALADELEPSGGVVTLGILREVGDWGEPAGSDLLQAADDIETYYLEVMKS